MKRTPLAYARDVWSTTRFGGPELTCYAEERMLEETRRGLMAMSFVSLLILVATALLYTKLGLPAGHSYTNALLAALSLHIFLSARVVRAIRVLHLLGMTLLTICGVAFVLLAHRTGSFSTVLLASAVLLFMVVPMVPWGLREALTVVALVYAVFTFSTWGKAARFDPRTLWTLQFVMLGASLVTLTLVARGALVRRDDLAARFELEGAHRTMELLSLQDPLTGVWNRRYLQGRYPEMLERAKGAGETLWFVLCDLNDFKRINDTLGHDCGDKVLQWLGAALRSQVAERGVAVRMGGDEFALLFSYHSPGELLRRSVESVRGVARRDPALAGARISLCAGSVALTPGSDLDLDRVYKEADAALYAAKRERNGSQAAVWLAGDAQAGGEAWAATC